jgi:hypothetical protein
MNKTATESIMDSREDFSDRSAVHDAMEHFTYHWAPSQPRKAAEFHADLLRLIQAVHRDSAKPMEAALTKAFACMSLVPLQKAESADVHQ